MSKTPLLYCNGWAVYEKWIKTLASNTSYGQGPKKRRNNSTIHAFSIPNPNSVRDVVSATYWLPRMTDSQNCAEFCSNCGKVFRR
jgi:hypothetical protein